MNQELLIKDIIGAVLEPEGFSYMGRVEGISEFLRKVKNSKEETIEQIISLQENRYCKEVFLNLESTAAGHDWNYRINDFAPDCTTDGLYFETQEKYKKVIEEFAEILSQYGIPFLEEIKEPIVKYYLMDKDYKKLFYEHERLVENFLKREKVKIEELNVAGAAELIEKKIKDIKEKPFEEVRNFLLELSALFGAVVKKYCPCQWILNEDGGCSLEFLKPREKGNAMFVIKILFWKWDELRLQEDNNISEDWKKKEAEKGYNFSQVFIHDPEYIPIPIKEELLSKYKSCTQ